MRNEEWRVKSFGFLDCYNGSVGEMLICGSVGDGPKSSLPLWGRWISVKTLAFLPKDGRGPCRWDNVC